MSLFNLARKIADEHQSKVPQRLPADIRELTGFRPRALQQKMSETMRRFNSWVVHRRFGKSVLAVNTLIERAIECPFPEGRYAYAGPTYDQTEDIVWTYLDEFTKDIPGRKVEKANLAVWLPTRRGGRSRIRLYGVDNPKQRIRGMYLDGVVLDEWAQIPPHVWTQQIRPMLSDDVRQGYDDQMNQNQWAIFIFTPFGRNHAYRMHKRADLWYRGFGSEDVNDAGESTGKFTFRTDWSAHLYPASVTRILSEKELADIRADMDSDESYQQEMECSFDAAVKGSIYGSALAEAKAAGRMTHVPYNPQLPVHTGWDLGFDDATAIWFVQLVGMEVRVIDYYEASGAYLDHFADVLARKDYRYGKHYLPHDVEVHDISAKGKSRLAILKDYGIRGTVVERHNPEDGIATGRAIIKRAWWDEARCGEGLDRLALYRRDYDERQQVFRQKPKHDWSSHGADAWRTLVMGMKRTPPGSNDWHMAPRAEL